MLPVEYGWGPMEKNIRETLDRLRKLAITLGARKLAAMGIVGALLFGAVLLGGIYLNHPQYQTLYVGLSREDVSRMGLALGEAGIRFDVSSDGTSLLVPFGKAEEARMYLAEKGLPTSANAGYEIFDHMGSLGLTSFMQQITRVRALEGEIARSIQAIRGVKAARVHLVMQERGSFRSEDQKPTAAVVIRTDSLFGMESARSIRQLVAAAVPGLEAGEVTVVDTDGRLLASGEEGSDGGAVMAAGLEQSVQSGIDGSIRRALAPYLGVGHFQSSVQVVLDTDKHQVKETVFDPNSKVERSVRIVREAGASENASQSTPTTVSQNVPQPKPANSGSSGANGQNSTEKNERREELTNYEINEKTTQTQSDGYSIKRLSVAVVLDRSQLIQSLGGKPDAGQIDAQIAKIHDLVATAAGIDTKRGDVVNVTAVDFMASAGVDMKPAATPVGDLIFGQIGTLVNAATLLGGIALILWFGVRPLLRQLEDRAAPQSDNLPVAFEAGNPFDMEDFPEGQATADAASLPKFGATAALPGSGGTIADDNLGDLKERMRVPPQSRFEQMIELDEERVAAILKQWVQEAA